MPSVHVTCSEFGVTNGWGDGGIERPMIPLNGWWSETMTTPGTTEQAAPPGVSTIFRIDVSSDVYVAIGPAPNASLAKGAGRNGTRYFIRANNYPYDFNANPGDKLAWVFAAGGA